MERTFFRRFLVGLSASVNLVFLLRASAVPEQACSAQYSAWHRFGMTKARRQRENDKRDKPNINESIRIIH